MNDHWYFKRLSQRPNKNSQNTKCAWTKNAAPRQNRHAPGQNMPRPPGQDRCALRQKMSKKNKNFTMNTNHHFHALYQLPFCIYINTVCSDWYPEVGYFVAAFRVHFSLSRKASRLHFDNNVVFRLGSKSVIVRFSRPDTLSAETVPSRG